jgi:hypothetical protein
MKAPGSLPCLHLHVVRYSLWGPAFCLDCGARVRIAVRR